MATDLQNAANQRNALKSTGPRSLAGKSASSRNAATHGLSARFPVMPGESEKHYLELHGALSKNLQPDGALEQQLVEDLASVFWRLRRVPRLEMALLQWVSHQERVLYDGANELDPPPMNHNAPCEAVDELADPLRLGRTLETMLNDGLLGKLTRYEVDLSKRVQRLLGDLNKMKAVRAQANPVLKQSDAFDHLTSNGKLKQP